MTSKFNKYNDMGLTGLANLGNTCFLNSTIQILSHTYEFNDFLENKNYQKLLNKSPQTILLLEWDKLRELMWSENCCISPNGFVQSVQKIAHHCQRDIFTGWAQNDLPEFLIFLFESFHKSLEREVKMEIKGTKMNKQDDLAIKCFNMMKVMYEKEYSEVVKLFTGIQVSKIISLTGDEYSVSPEPVTLINLPIPNKKNINIYDCFDLYTHEELLNQDNAWFNEKTKEKEDVLKCLKFWMLPEILIVDLKRFNNRNQKNNKFIDAPLNNLDLSKYVIGYNKTSYIYELYGVSNHMGGSQGGHYTAHVKNASGKWYLFNDTQVKEITDESKIVTQQAYCFFYRKKN